MKPPYSPPPDVIVPKPAKCEVHDPDHHHHPVPRDQELHHVIPRDWQRGGWKPDTPPYPGVYIAFGIREQLWDARVIEVPPSCHRNVHQWIVAVMRQLAAMQLGYVPTAADVTRAVALVIRANKPVSPEDHRELTWATEAPLRYVAAGGDLRQLIQRRSWGQS